MHIRRRDLATVTGAGAKPRENFLAGVIEGFYGRAWSQQLRAAYAGFLADTGLNTYLYAPKNDPYLRREWQSSWPEEKYTELRTLADTYRERELLFGVGLSPFALYQSYGAAEREALRRKVSQINSLGVAVLAILFDDMPGDQPDLAARQVEIVADILQWSEAGRHLVCPTYYSFDPILEKVFGRRPPDYWQRLGEALPSGVDIFWTGAKVCSDQVARADIEAAAAELGRPLVLWDNYPVNDGQKMSRFLHLRALSGRDELPDCPQVSGHLCNPMNQGYLSLLPLFGLASLYGSSGDFPTWAQAHFGESLARQLLSDIPLVQDAGLDGLEPEQRQRLLQSYSQFQHPAAQEMVAWLRGEYTFDPACLTD